MTTHLYRKSSIATIETRRKSMNYSVLHRIKLFAYHCGTSDYRWWTKVRLRHSLHNQDCIRSLCQLPNLLASFETLLHQPSKVLYQKLRITKVLKNTTIDSLRVTLLRSAELSLKARHLIVVALFLCRNKSIYCLYRWWIFDQWHIDLYGNSFTS